MRKFYAVMMSDKRVIAIADSFDECSSAALDASDWFLSGEQFAPYVIQDFAPGEHPKFFMINHQCVIGGEISAGQSYGRVERVRQ